MNQSGLLDLLSTLAPHSTTINGTDASYGGLFANASGHSLDRGVLLNEEYDWFFIQHAGDLRERILRALGGLLESGTHTVTKSGVHERFENHASHLLIDTPEYGHWDQYEPVSDQLSPSGVINTKVNLVAVSHSPEPASYDVETFAIEEAVQYLDDVRTITPAVSDVLAEEIVAHAHRINEAIEREVLIQIHPHAIRRFAETSARLDASKTVEEVHLTDVVELLEACLKDLGAIPDEEEEEVEYDVNVIETGRTKTDRDRVKGLKEIVRELQEEYDTEPGAPEKNVYDRAGQHGIEQTKTKHEIQKLWDKGEIYSPDQEHLRLV